MSAKYVLFGAGYFGQKAFQFYGEDHVEYFIDNNQDKWGQELFGKKIISLDEYKELADDYTVVIASGYEDEMSKQLEHVGISRYLYYSPIYENFIRRLQDLLAEFIPTGIVLFGLDQYTKQLIQAIAHFGLQDRIICIAVASDSTFMAKTYMSYDVKNIDSIEAKADCYIVSAEKNNEALFLELRQRYQKEVKINPFKEIGFYNTEQVVLNVYETSDGERTEEDWNQFVANDKTKAAVRAYVDVAVKDVQLFRFIEIETINRCNGVCSFCPVNRLIDPRTEVRMSEALFTRIIDELAEMNYSGELSLFSNNEPLLDERIITFHKYAREKLPGARMHLYTNGTLFTLPAFIELIQYLDELIIDNYNRDLQLIRPCREIKAYVEEHQELRKKVTIALRKPDEVLTSRGGDAPNRKQLISYGNETCVLPFEQMIVRPDGKISLCCNDPLGKNTLGDLNKESLLDVWYGPKFQMVRKCLSKGRKEWKHCEYCDTFNIW